MKCDTCGKFIATDCEETVESKTLCPDCHDNNVVYCEHCNEHFLKENTECFNGEYYCEPCFNNVTHCCDWCNDRVFDEDTHFVCGECICESCLENGAFCCDSCGETLNNEYYADDGCCNQCGNNRSSYNPSYKYHKTQKDMESTPRLYFGIEIELENDDYIEIEDELPDFMWSKEDGSLSSRGVEFVTHPLTYNWLLDNKGDIDNVLSMIDNHGFYPNRDCGIHIHLSRKCFNPEHLFKFAVLFNISEDFTYKLSDREYIDDMEEYAYCDLTINEIRRNINTRFGPRYTAVNINNKHTVEVRIFGSTTNIDNLYAKVQICLSAFEYTQNENVLNVTTDDYLNYIEQNKDRFKELYFYLKARNIVKVKETV
jgi:hypothetical protein